MDKDKKEKLSPFSALKFSSPPRNLVVKLNRINVESYRAPPEAEKSKKSSKPGPMTRSRTGVVSKPVKKFDEHETNEEEVKEEIKSEETEKVFHNKKYNRIKSKTVTGPRNDQPSTSGACPRSTSVKDTFRFDLKESPKRDSKPVDRHDSKPVDRHDSKPVDRHDLKPVDRHDSKPVDRYDSKPVDRHDLKPVDRHDLKPVDRHDSKPVDRHDSHRGHRETFPRRESIDFRFQRESRDQNYRNNGRGRNIFPQRGLPMRYNLDMFNPAVPPPARPGLPPKPKSLFDIPPPGPPPKPKSVFNIPPPVSNYSFNIPVPDDFRKEILQLVDVPKTQQPKPSAASVFRFELPSDLPQASAPDVADRLQGLQEKRQQSKKLVDDYLKSVGFTEEPARSKRANSDSLMEVDEDTKMTIDMAQAILGQVLRKLDVISKHRRSMEKDVDLISNYEWGIKSQQYDIYRREIVEMLEPLMSSTAIEGLQQRLRKRRAKMAWAHERNKVYRSRKQMEKERRVRTKAFIDYWHERWQALEREKRNNEEEKKLAQRLLPDVNRRIAETKEFIKIFGRLKQLSVARLVADGQNGQNVEGQVEEFNKNMDELQAVWDDLLMEYQEEKIMLDTLIDRRTSHAPLPPEPQSVEQNWLETLFGQESIYDDQNPYLFANRSIIELLNIRNIWDQYLAPEDAAPGVGSSIPIFWALPSTTPTIGWRKYRRQN